jgi:hypothetical protein
MSQTFLTDSNNDLYLDSNNNLAIVKTSIGITAELAKNYLRTFLNEILVDQSLGLDFFGIMFNDFASLEDKIEEIERVCLTIPLVDSIESVGYTQDKITGVISFNPILVTSLGYVTIDNIMVG